MTTQDPWWAHDIIVCLTFARHRGPAHVLDAYGAAAEPVRELTLQQARTTLPIAEGGVVLRTGVLGDGEWAFCHESGEPEGFKEAVLSRLSAGTEAVQLYSVNGMTTLERYRGGVRIESFEAGFPSTLRSGPDHPLWDAVQVLPDRSTATQAAEGVQAYLGVRIDGDVLEGPLPTAYLPPERRAPLSSRAPAAPEDASSQGLGRLLPGLPPHP
ncbi:DUF6461 domain-containing protein [Kitasatospora sp. NBC_00085]|uniref:DUF6461 domain-containing protein n=1 Tax=unclassified Kitasatospora TaxID=2633591 RepID=UPI0032434451